MHRWYYDIPKVTRLYLTGVVLVTLACTLHLVSPIHLFFSWRLIVYRREYWRLLSSFFFFGDFSFDFFLHLFFLSRYSRMLEEDSFHGKSVDYLWMLIFGCLSIIGLAPVMSYFGKSTSFLANPLTFMLIYVWSRRNPNVRMNMFGVLNFNAPYLPFVLIGFPILVSGHFPWHDIPGLIVGHVYYFFEDVLPRMPHSQGKRYLATPLLLKVLFGQARNPGNDAYVAVEADQEDQLEVEGELNDQDEPLNSGWEDLADEMNKTSEEAAAPGGYEWKESDGLRQRTVAPTNQQQQSTEGEQEEEE